MASSELRMLAIGPPPAPPLGGTVPAACAAGVVAPMSARPGSAAEVIASDIPRCEAVGAAQEEGRSEDDDDDDDDDDKQRCVICRKTSTERLQLCNIQNFCAATITAHEGGAEGRAHQQPTGRLLVAVAWRVAAAEAQHTESTQPAGRPPAAAPQHERAPARQSSETTAVHLYRVSAGECLLLNKNKNKMHPPGAGTAAIYVVAFQASYRWGPPGDLGSSSALHPTRSRTGYRTD
eukprot:COSAG01_NODE_11323_length_1959_cov_1.353763_2_plen_235_part_00